MTNAITTKQKFYDRAVAAISDEMDFGSTIENAREIVRGYLELSSVEWLDLMEWPIHKPRVESRISARLAENERLLQLDIAVAMGMVSQTVSKINNR